MSTTSVSEIYLTGNAAEFAAAMDEAAESAASTASSIDASFDTVGGSASASAADVSSSYAAAGEEMSASMEAATAKVDASFEGVDASAASSAEAMRASAAEGAEGMSAEVAASTAATGDTLVEGMGAAGLASGEAAREGVAVGTDAMAEDLAGAGLLAGSNLKGGVSEGAEGLEDDLSTVGEDGGAALAEGAAGGGERVRGMLSNLGVPESLLTGWTGLAAGIGVVAAAGLDFASKMQTADTAVANSAGISTAAAKSIGTAFLHMSSEFDGQEMASVFATVAGQLKATEGHALSTAQAVSFMGQATNLATADQISLGTATKSVASVMQSYQMSVKDTVTATDALYVAGHATGQSVTSVSAAVDKVKTKLGGLAPTLGQVSSLLVDMTDHGETGRAAMSSLTTAFTNFLKPAADVATAENDLKAALGSLTPQLASLAKSVMDGKVAMSQLTTAETSMTAKQQALFSSFTSAYSATQTASEAYKKLGVTVETATGKLRPLGTIIGQVHDKIEGESTAAAVATLKSMGFGSAATKLVKVFQSGSGAFDQASDSVTKVGTAATGASKEGGTLHVMLKTVESTTHNLVTEFGQDLLPVVDLVEHGFLDVVNDGIVPLARGIGDAIDWFKKMSPAALAVAGVLALVFMPGIINLGETVASTVGKMAIGMADWVAEQATGAESVVSGWLGMGAAAEEAEVTSDAAMDGMATATEAAAVETDAALGSTGIGAILIGVGLAATLLATHWHQVWDGIKDVVSGVWSFLAGIWHDIDNDVHDIWGDISSFLHSTVGQIVMFIINPIAGMANLIHQHWATIESDAKAVWGDIVSFFEGLPSKMLSIGEDILKGLEHGIEDGVSDVIGAAKHAGDEVVDAFKDVFSIFSPSHVTHTHGLMLMEGLATGIEDGTAGAVAAATAASAKVLGAFSLGSVSAASRAAAGGTSDPSLIGGGGVAGGGGATAGPVTVNLHITARGALTDANALAKQLTPQIRTQLLQMQRSMGGPVNVTTGLGFTSSR